MKKETIEKLVKLDNKIKELIGKRSSVMLDLISKHGESSHVCKMDKPDKNGKQYLRVKLVDNNRKILDGVNVWKSVVFSPVEMEVSLLKNEPKSK